MDRTRRLRGRVATAAGPARRFQEMSGVNQERSGHARAVFRSRRALARIAQCRFQQGIRCDATV